MGADQCGPCSTDICLKSEIQTDQLQGSSISTDYVKASKKDKQRMQKKKKEFMQKSNLQKQQSASLNIQSLLEQGNVC